MADEKRRLHPDTTSVGGGYDAAEHMGSLKPPVYETSTFVFETAEQGKRFFEEAYGDGDSDGYIYSRLDSPNLGPAEHRLAFWEEAEDAVLFGSGMAAIASVFLTFLRPGDLVVYSQPTYGGTAALLEGLLPRFGVTSRPFRAGVTTDELKEMTKDEPLAMVYLETPANPTNDLFDIEMAASVASSSNARLVVDNTFLSPVWQRPLAHGADLSLHSATKYLGGHSDITAGVVCGSAEDVAALKRMRYEIGTTPSPSTAWLLGRSLETLRLRVEQQTLNATRIAAFLADHDKVKEVRHLSLLEEGTTSYDIYKRQCLGPGAMVTFEIDGGEEECFRLLDAMEVVRLATSLGGTESLASHMWTMSPPSISPEVKRSLGVTPAVIRLSVGIEDADDLISDLRQALAAV